MNLLYLIRRWWGHHHPTPTRRPRKTRLSLESLEDRQLLSCNTISGFVYQDANNNGLYDPGEQPLASVPLALLNSAGTVVGTAVTDGNGYYAFSTDSTIGTATQTVSNALSFPAQRTNWTNAQSIPRFDPSLGQLTAVEIINHGVLTAQIQVESLDHAPQTITATVAGSLTLTGTGVSSLVASSTHSETFFATAYDGNSDYGGTSGHNFGAQSVDGSRSTILTSPSILAQYTGSGSISFTERATGSSSATSTGGNLLNLINSSAEGDVTIVYHYTPNNCLRAGDYTIVETQQPPGYIAGEATRGNQVPLPNSLGSNVIPVHLSNGDLPNNDFGKLLPASVSGYEYYDIRNHGVREPVDPPIPGTLITLTGTDVFGQGVYQSMQTSGDGSYAFTGLRPGSYTITETEPAGYVDGRNNLGSLGGGMGNDQFFIALGQGDAGVQYNFGELKQIAVTNGGPPIHRRLPLSKVFFLSSDILGFSNGKMGRFQRHGRGHARHHHDQHHHHHRFFWLRVPFAV